MNSLLDPNGPVIHAVLANGVKASLLACVVVAVCLLLRRWLSPGWRHVLWCAVFVRLLLPDLPVPGGNWSVSQWIPAAAAATQEPATTGLEASRHASPPEASVASVPEAAVAAPGDSFEAPIIGDPSPAVAAMPSPVAHGGPLQVTQVLLGLWLLGTAAWWTALAVASWRFKRRVLDTSVEADAEAQSVLASCLAEAGVRARVALRSSAGISAPSVCGVFRHAILLPQSLEHHLSRADLRLLLLHELGHVKRHDSISQVLASLLLGLHWWNPVLWLAWHRLRHEAEAATDAWVLRRTGERSAPVYGNMLLTLASRVCLPGALLVLIPSLIRATSHGRRLKQRILDIACHRPARRWAVVPGLLVFCCLVMAGFSQQAAPKSEEAKPADPAASAKSGAIGGIVVDAQGQPVANAEVRIHITTTPNKAVKSVLPAGYQAPAAVQTDAQGRWQITGVPAGVMPANTQLGTDTFALYVTHPEFLFQSFSGDSSSSDAPFRNGTAKLELQRGLVLTGVVRDEAGNPIAGASVQRNLVTTPQGDRAVKSDDTGKYEMKSARRGNHSVRVSARGFATQLQRLNMTANTVQDFTLKKAQTLKLRIQDDDGKPVEGASLAIFPLGAGWNAADRLWQVEKVPADGMVVWEEAPSGEVVVDVLGSGHANVSQKVTTGGEVSITLPAEKRLPVITIKVTAADSGAPLPGCTFDTSASLPTSSDTRAPNWVFPGTTDTRSVKLSPTGVDGEYRGSIPESALNMAMKFGVRHGGYIPQLTPRVDPKKGDTILTVALQKGKPLDLVVRDHRDAPVEKADIYVSWHASIHLRDGIVPSGSPSARMLEFIGITGEDGRCVIPPCANDASVLVMHESGYALVPFADVARSASLKLGVYAQVAANVKRDGKPASGVTCVFSGGTDLPGGILGLIQNWSGVSNSEGRISLSRVLPTRIGRFAPQTPPMRSPNRVFAPFGGTQRVPAGETTVFDVDLREMPECTVAGRFVLQGGGVPESSRTSSVSVNLSRKSQFGSLMTAGMGRADAEGRFKFEGVTPGDYFVSIYSSPVNPARYALAGEKTEIPVTVPDPGSGTADKSIDLGEIEMVEVKK